MPHIIVKMQPGKTEAQKERLSAAITQAVIDILGNSEAAISVSMEDVEKADWKEKVYEPYIVAQPDKLYKKPGYTL
jgi:4-oxalocrotonate tautomerase